MTEQRKAIAARSVPPVDSIQRRLEDAIRLFEEGLAPTAEGKKKILKERAKELARERKVNLKTKVDLLEFVLSYDRYAIELGWIREVYPLKEITPLPGTPPFVAGVINVRGGIVSVIDLKTFFDLPPKGLTNLDRVIIVTDGQMEFGLLADAVSGVRSIPREEIQPPLPTLTGLRTDYFQGVTADHLVILDVAKLLTAPAMRVGHSTET